MSDPLPTLLPSMTAEQIAALCERYSTAECAVYAVVESIRGRPVVRLARERLPHEISLLRPQAGGIRP